MEALIIAATAVAVPVTGLTLFYSVIKPRLRRRYERKHHANKRARTDG